MSQINYFTFVTNSGGEQSIPIQNYNKGHDLEFYTGDAYKTAISGKLRQNTKGVRTVYSLKWSHTVNEDVIKDIVDNIYQDLVTDERTHIFISEGDTADNIVAVVPTENMIYEIEFLDQFGKAPEQLEFITLNLDDLEGGWVETGWVETGWVE